MNNKLVIIFLAGLLFFTNVVQAQQVKLTIQVIPPGNTPSGDTLLVIGDQAIWGNWIYPRSVRMQQQGGVWVQEYFIITYLAH